MAQKIVISREELAMKSIVAKLVQAAATGGTERIPKSEPLFGVFFTEAELNSLLWHFGVKTS